MNNLKNRVKKLEQTRINIPERRLVIFEFGGIREPTEAEIAAYKKTVQWAGHPAHIVEWNGERFDKGMNTDIPPVSPNISSITVTSEETVDLLFEICKGVEPHREGEL
jgi:hypothetical protein